MGGIRRSELILLSLMLLVCSLDSADDVPGCPAACECTHPAGNASLEIACPERSEGKILEQEIEALLRAADTPLTSLSISKTQLWRIPEAVCSLTALTQLRLDNNQLNALPDNCLSRLSALTLFSAANNRITHLQDGLFDGLESLEQLMLDHNKISTIGLGVFSNSSDLLRLKVVNLANNLLSSLEPWPMIRVQVLPGFSADINGNRVSTFTNVVNWTYNCSDKKIKFAYNLRVNNLSHTSAFVDTYFATIEELVCFMSSRATGFELGYNPLICDCLDYLIYVICAMFPHASGYYIDVFCKNVIPEIRASAFKPEDAVCDVKTQCPAGCRCINQPSNLTFHVLCAGVGMKELPNDMPPLDLPKRTLLMPTNLPMYKLDFSRNDLKILEVRSYFNNTKILDVSGSQIENVTDEALEAMQNIKRIYLHDNFLTTLPRSVTTMNFSFTSLSLQNNPLDCSCDQVWLKDWLITVRDRLENSDGIHCNTPARLRGKIFLLVNNTDFCYEPSPDDLDPRMLAAAISALLVPVLFITLFLVLLRFRVKSYKMFRFHPFDRDECAGEEMTYDVFISYAHEDKELAREILAFLEDNDCKVCYHQRDFVPGEPIYENILEAIHMSKRVLCLITPKFLQSEYCMDEFTIAHSHNVEKKRRRLIIMKQEEFDIDAVVNAELSGDQPNVGAEIDHTTHLLAAESDESGKLNRGSVLADFVKRHTYIDLSADSWKDQLLYAMPINRLGLPLGDHNN